MEREKADFQGSGAVAAMNDRLMKEVEAEDYYMEMGEEEDLSGEC